ncbi:SDR family NAD(P)-dependent oxidoreductase [Amycolatopsis sp. CA-230715]|uniref:SDR family NAD(P)-dependent oxidoreductase n=1 Tax=Amycolatopsis sp. CA-230715 TaxID=2745196 RepID=UPI001C01B387|nr:SDR family oxidoreductase [Amycolatopsis sp. CA-230715]QWF84609.1 Putative oxidoreductase [Amycolatopsis sp. CA-230715]
MTKSREVVVTGGGTGIGYAAAAHFRALGDSVTITGRRADVLRAAAERLGARAIAFDAADPAAVSTALGEFPETVDVLVNNAGGNTDLSEQAAGDGLAETARAWRANFDANVLTAVLMTEALAERFADGARIITIGSIAARTGAASYGAAKAAVEAWTADVARAFGPRGITANIVSPGLTENTEFFHGKLSAERAKELAEDTMTKRAGTPEDIAEVIGFLASAGSGHVTGQVVHVNGGAFLGR